MGTNEQGRREKLTECSNPELADVIERNIGTILDIRAKEEDGKTLQDRIADGITDFSGSMAFLYVHIAWFGAWLAVNLGWIPGVKPFDPYPFGLLTMIVSLEAIFLSTFVLISQNRMAKLADERADLDLQINLLAEHEITLILRLVDAIAHKLELDVAKDPEIDQLTSVTMPDVIVKELHEREKVAEILTKIGRRPRNASLDPEA